MERVVLVIHLMVTLALIGVVLMQKSEGGALGIGGGGGMGNFMTGRGTANVLTRTTAILAACFMATSLFLVILPQLHGARPSILPGNLPATQVPAPTAPTQPAPPTGQPSTGQPEPAQGQSAPAQGSTTPAKPTTPAAPSVPLGQ
jgi:preprotein translocase subunit SecG